MKIKVSEASGVVLDWLVAKCEGLETELIGVKDDNDPIKFWHNATNQRYQFSTRWGIGGPITDREHIHIRPTLTEGGYRTSDSNDAVHATIELPNGATRFDPEKVVSEYGPTPLVAAMRCYVVSKLGEEVEVPEELLK